MKKLIITVTLSVILTLAALAQNALYSDRLIITDHVQVTED